MSIVRIALESALHVFKLDSKSNEHGIPHWVRVWNNARQLADNVLGVDTYMDRHVLCWFAFLHDCKRENDGHDPQHGARAAAYAKRLWEAGTIALDVERMVLLHSALEGHSMGYKRDVPLVLTCWDADRLDLTRCGVQPDPGRMCTAAGVAAARALPRINPVPRQVLILPQYGRRLRKTEQELEADQQHPCGKAQRRKL